MLLDEHPELFVIVDETHKDRNTARRRRKYGKKNNGGVKLNKWFKNAVGYTNIGVADINDFIESTCTTLLRDGLSEEGTTGTMTRDIFEKWIKRNLFPILGNFESSFT